MLAEKHLQKKDRLWTSSFFLLWHGQLISGFGDRILQIALGFWVLAFTNSTALMGIMMSLTGLPRVIIPTFFGTTLQSMNKKIVLVLMNAIRGIFVIILGLAALIGYVQLWMIFAAGMIINSCGAFFNPAVKSSLPEIVADKNLGKANSITDMLRAGAFIFGNFVGALLFQILGASQMFLLNGVSYLISAFTSLLIKLPEEEEKLVREGAAEISREESQLDLTANPVSEQSEKLASSEEDEADFDEKLYDLRYPLIIAAIINFLGNLGLILFLPLFQNMRSFTSGNNFNLLLAFILVSTLLGAAFTFIVSIPPDKRLTIFVIGNILAAIGYSTWPFFTNRPILPMIIFILGLFGAVYNVFITSNIQLAVPEKIRGKVFGWPGLIFPGLAPAAMAVGGILAEFVPVKIVIFVSQILILFAVIPLAKVKMFRHFINFDASEQTLEDIVRM